MRSSPRPRALGAITLCDATQALGWLPLDAGRFDALVCGAYKWLMAPRGTAFLTVSDRLLGSAVPHSAGWYAGEDVHASYFGPPLRLAAARGGWTSRRPGSPGLGRAGAGGDRADRVDAIHEHDVALANRYRAGIGLEPSDSAIVCADLPGAAERLEAAGIVAAVRGGRLRTSWHLYNDEADVDRVLEVVTS